MSEKTSSREKQYSEAEKLRMLNDLRGVGESKLVGYLPKSTLVDICGVTVEEMKTELGARGLVVVDLDESESSINSGAIYVYEPTALAKLLQSNKHILEKNGWPTEPDAFVRHLKVYAKDKDLFGLVADAFGDKNRDIDSKIKNYGKKDQ